jgi:hypothetical protein
MSDQQFDELMGGITAAMGTILIVLIVATANSFGITLE